MVWTLTIKDRVYDELVKLKGKGESFSDLFEGLAAKGKPDITEFAGFLSDATAKKMRKTLAEYRARSRKFDLKREKRLEKPWQA